MDSRSPFRRPLDQPKPIERTRSGNGLFCLNDCMSTWELEGVMKEGKAKEGALLDIVAIHGFRGDRMWSWTHTESGALWLMDFLGEDLEDTNIYTFGYSSSASVGSAAKDLIQSFEIERSSRANFDIPIVFIASDTGGLVVKQALAMLASYQAKSPTRILTNTRVLVFLGTPHRGIRESWAGANTIVNLLNTWTYFQTEKLPSQKELQQMLEAFAPISDRFQIYNVVPTRGVSWIDKKLISDPMTYIMGITNEEVASVDSTLMELSKFHGRGDPNYRRILAILQRASRIHGVRATEDWQKRQMFRLDGAESEMAKQWLTDLREDAHRVVDSRPVNRRSKIAILDTGIDRGHPVFQESVAEGRIVAKSFIDGLPGDQDSDGHGTHAAHLALQVAPNSKLFIARVIEDGSQTEFEENISAIVEAIKWAVSQGVDIISMSFGYRVANDEIKVAIRDAFHRGIILVAAASNSGVNPRFPISFPASMRQVICVHSSDGNGNPSAQNPPATPDCNLAILGEQVAAAWPQRLETGREDKLRVASGTSVATPIAAGLAALIIEYAAQSGQENEVVTRWMQLRHCDEMRKVFGALARERSGYQSIAPSSLFDYHGEEMHQRVAGRINDILDSL